MNKSVNFILIFVLLLISLTSFEVLYSQNNKREKGEARFQKRWDRIEELKKLKMLEELNLPEDISFKFYTRYINFKNQMKEIEKERWSMLDEIEGILKDPENPEIQNKIEAYENLDQKLWDARKSFFKDLRNIIPIDKIARYFVFERNFQRELQSILRDVQMKKSKKD